MTFAQTRGFMLSRLRFRASVERGRQPWNGCYMTVAGAEFARRLSAGIAERIEARFVDDLYRERTEDH